MEQIDITIQPQVTRVIEMGFQGPAGPPGTSTLVTLTAGAALGGGRIVTVDAGGTAIYADSSTVAHSKKVVGLTLGAASIGAPVEVQSSGEVIEPSWAWTTGQALYLGTSGMLVVTPPVTGFSLIVGFAIAPTKIILNIGMPIILLP